MTTGQGGLVGNNEQAGKRESVPVAGWHGKTDNCEVGQRRAGPDTQTAETERQPEPMQHNTVRG